MRKRSKYRPKGVVLDVMTYVKSGIQTVASVPEAGVNLRLRNHMAFDEIMKGEPTSFHANDLIEAFNIAEALAILGIGNDYRAEIWAAQDAVFNMAKRGVDKGSYRFNASELEAVRFGMELHDEQLRVAAVKEMEQALVIVNKTIKARKARVVKKREEANA